jgi:hypothetical protein
MTLAVDLETLAARMDTWVVKDGSRERGDLKSSLVRKKFVRKANDSGRHVQSMYGWVPSMGLERAAGNKLEKVVFKGDPLSTLIKVGGRSAIAIVKFTCLIAPDYEAPFSLPQFVRSLLAPSCTLMSYSFSLPVV